MSSKSFKQSASAAKASQDEWSMPTKKVYSPPKHQSFQKPQQHQSFQKGHKGQSYQKYSNGSQDVRTHVGHAPMNLINPRACMPFSWKITPTCPRKPYNRREDEKFARVYGQHWGQLKLFTNELKFLMKALFTYHDVQTVVYAGSAPGNHLKILEKMINTLIDMSFPGRVITFVCYDPTEFMVDETDTIEIRQRLFLNTDLKEFTQPIVFISDIRSGDPKVHLGDVHEERVCEDNKIQLNWISSFADVRMSMIKFRCPYPNPESVYAGKCTVIPACTIDIQAYPGSSSTESRAVFSRPINWKQYTDVERYLISNYEAAIAQESIGFRVFDASIMRFVMYTDDCDTRDNLYFIMSNVAYEEMFYCHNHTSREHLVWNTNARGINFAIPPVDLKFEAFDSFKFTKVASDMNNLCYDNTALLLVLEEYVSLIPASHPIRRQHLHTIFRYLLCNLTSYMSYRDRDGRSGRVTIRKTYTSLDELSDDAPVYRDNKISPISHDFHKINRELAPHAYSS